MLLVLEQVIYEVLKYEYIQIYGICINKKVVSLGFFVLCFPLVTLR